MIVIAVAVTLLLRVPITQFLAGGAGATVGLGATIAGGALAGAAGSIASQGFGVAAGIQDKFSFKAVAMSAIGGGVAAGLGEVIQGAGTLAAIGRGVLGNAITQGIGVATGLQKKFDFMGVAAAGIVAGVGNLVGQAMKIDSMADGWQKDLLVGASNMAGGIAAAAARSLVEGTNFGDNLMSVLPDVVGSTIGSIVARGIYNPQGPTRNMSDAEKGEALNALSDVGETTEARNTPQALASSKFLTAGLEPTFAPLDLGGFDIENIPIIIDNSEATLEALRRAILSRPMPNFVIEPYIETIVVHPGSMGSPDEPIFNNISISDVRKEVLNRKLPRVTGGYYGNFGIAFGPGFMLHFDGDGVTASIGAGIWGRAEIGKTFNNEAFVDIRQEDRFFISGKLGKSGPGAGIEMNEAADEGSVTVGLLKLRIKQGEGVEVGTVFDVGGKSDAPSSSKTPSNTSSSKPDANFSVNLDKDAVSFGFDAGGGWVHTLGTNKWNPPK